MKCNFAQRLCLLWVVALLCGGANLSLGQVVSGNIVGTVSDPSGSPIPNAKVRITSLGRNTAFEAITNDSGNYSKGQLTAGVYSVQVEATGFKTGLVNNVTVSVDTTQRVDLRLEVGNVTERIEVTAEAPLIKSDRADVATIFNTQQLLDLPSYDRTFQAYQLLTPGTQRVPWQHASSENPQGSVQIQVNGQHFSSTDYQLDGTSNQDPILGIIVINPTIDSVVEAKMSSQNFDAEFGLAAAGVMNLTTKSGSNQFHGSLFEFNRTNSPGFNTFARNPFNSAENKKTPSVVWNQFGGSIGGAAIKNKLFGFGDAQITRRRTGSSVLTSVPTDAARTGDFSQYLEPLSGGASVGVVGGGSTNLMRQMIFDPLTGSTATGEGRQAFAGNRIPASRLSPQAVKLLASIPRPNSVQAGTAPFRRNFANTGSEAFDSNQWNNRWDYFLNEHNSIFGRYSYASFTKYAPGAFGDQVGGSALDNIGFAGTSDVANQSLALGYTRTWSPSLISEMRFGYMRYRVNVLPNGMGTSPAKDAGIPKLNVDPFFTSGMPAFFVEGEGGFNFGYGLGVNQCNCPLAQKEQQWQFVINTTKLKGNHSYKFGADLRFATNLRVPSDAHRSGELSFSPNFTGYVPAAGAGVQQGLGLATFLLGQTTGFRRYVSPVNDASERQKRLFWFAQDTWRVNNKLTLNYGLRWEMLFPETVNAAGNGGQLDLRTGEIAVFGVGGVPMSGLQKMKWSNFAPRLGVTYAISPRTVVRAGYGWSYGLGTFGSIFGHNVTQNLPVLAVQSLNRPNDFSGVFTLDQGPVDPTFPKPDSNGRFKLPNGVSGKARPENLKMPLSMAFNVSVQHQLTKSLSIDLAYVGNQGRNVFAGDGPNFNVNEAAFVPGVADSNIRKPFYSKFGWTQGIDLYCNCATNSYNSFQMRFEQRTSYGLTFNGSYTYQKNVGDSGDSFTFLYNRPLGRGNKDWITHQIFTLPINYELPFGKGKKFLANGGRAMDLTFGGWLVNATTYVTSGRPFTPYIGDSPAGAIRPNAGPGNRPDLGSGDPYSGAAGNRNQWFKGGLGGYFVVPANNVFGNFPLNSMYGPGYYNQDLSLAKMFKITETVKAQLRGEAFNVWNHTSLGDPNNNVTSTEAGRITGLAPGAQMRRLQLAFRLDF
ncbi:MAG: TonB-dependent receptor [Acidobacteria bacterium]|nr:TonB-dependent receptor [Acidobacteriota bacterium]